MEQLAQFAGVVALVGLLFGGLREWREARRIVPIAGLDADTIIRHGCVPVQISGSKYRLVGALVAVSGFLFVTPNTRKQVFWVHSAVGVRSGSEINYAEIRAGDNLRVVLEDGERPNTFVKSLKRGSSGGYRTIAIRDLDSPRIQPHAHCVTVRTRGVYAPTSIDGRVPQWLQYDMVAAAPRRGFANGEAALGELPDDAMHLVITPTIADRCNESRRTPTPTQLVGAFRRLMLRRNVNPWVALLHIVVRYGIYYLLLLVSSPALRIPAVAALLGPPVLMASLAFWRSVWRKMLQETHQHPRKEPVEAQRIGETEEEWLPTQLVNTTPPKLWTGATSHCMSAGRVVNGTDAKTILQHWWQRFSYLFKDIRRLYARFTRTRAKRTYTSHL